MAPRRTSSAVFIDHGAPPTTSDPSSKGRGQSTPCASFADSKPGGRTEAPRYFIRDGEGVDGGAFISALHLRGLVEDHHWISSSVSNGVRRFP
jgi:hypothetical protein